MLRSSKHILQYSRKRLPSRVYGYKVLRTDMTRTAFELFSFMNYRHNFKIGSGIVCTNWDFLPLKVCFMENYVPLTKYENTYDKITVSVGALSHFNLFRNCAKNNVNLGNHRWRHTWINYEVDSTLKSDPDPTLKFVPPPLQSGVMWTRPHQQGSGHQRKRLSNALTVRRRVSTNFWDSKHSGLEFDSLSRTQYLRRRVSV